MMGVARAIARLGALFFVAYSVWQTLENCARLHGWCALVVEEYSDEQFVPSVVEQFCKIVYEDDDHFIFFKPFFNLYFSVYADALLWYQQGKIDYKILHGVPRIELDGRQPNTSQRKAIEDVYRVNARDGGSL